MFTSAALRPRHVVGYEKKHPNGDDPPNENWAVMGINGEKAQRRKRIELWHPHHERRAADDFSSRGSASPLDGRPPTKPSEDEALLPKTSPLETSKKT